MNQEQRNNIYRKAISIHGERAQLEMAQEEATELALAIRRLIRNRDGAISGLISEIADVEIMIEQLKFLLPDISLSVETEKLHKLNRLNNRLAI